MKLRVVGAKMFHVDGQTNGQADIMKINSRFSQFCEIAFKDDNIHCLKEKQVNEKNTVLWQEFINRRLNTVTYESEQAPSQYRPGEALRVPGG